MSNLNLLNEILKQRFYLQSIKAKQEAFSNEELISDLRGINLSGRVLHDFVLAGTDVRWANFSDSKLSGPIQDADLSTSNFSNAKIVNVDFWNVKLACCDFEGGEIRDSIFNGVDAINSNFNNAIFENTKFYSSDLRGASFNNSSFKKCIFHSVKLNLSLREWFEIHGNECRIEKIEWCE